MNICDRDEYMHGMGWAMGQMYNEEKKQNRDSFSHNFRYMDGKKLEQMIDKLSSAAGFYLKRDSITLFGKSEPYAKYDGSRWNIKVFPNGIYDPGRLESVMELKGIFSKYCVPYEIIDLKEAKKILFKEKKNLENLLLKL